MKVLTIFTCQDCGCLFKAVGSKTRRKFCDACRRERARDYSHSIYERYKSEGRVASLIAAGWIVTTTP